MTTWRAIYERMFQRGPDLFSRDERETIREAIEEAWNAGARASRSSDSGIREAGFREGIEAARKACGDLMLEPFPGPRQALAEAVRRLRSLSSSTTGGGEPSPVPEGPKEK